MLQDSLRRKFANRLYCLRAPADSNTEETLNTLKYANRARNIKNMCGRTRRKRQRLNFRCKAQLAAMRSQVIALTQALNKAKGGDGEVKEHEVVVVSDELSGKLAASEREVQG